MIAVRLDQQCREIGQPVFKKQCRERQHGGITSAPQPCRALNRRVRRPDMVARIR
jgi:hypothetical protein